MKMTRVNHGTKGAVAAVENEGALAAAKILRLGGNAADATIAGAFVQTVVDPWRTSIGGGAHILYHSATERRTYVIDAGGVAPLRASATMFTPVRRWENAFVVRNNENRWGYRAQVVPGFIRGMDTLYRLHGSGKLSWSELVQPAIDRASRGFSVHPTLYAAWQPGQSHTELEGDPLIALSYSEESRRLYLKEDGSVYRTGEMLVQDDLARTLKVIAEGGADEFYSGSIAKRIAEDFAESGGLLSAEDLEIFEAEESEPIFGTYRGLVIATENAPSVGPTILQVLNTLELADVASMGWNSPAYLDYLTQTLFVAFRDRDQHVGDPNTEEVDLSWLLSLEYAQKTAGQAASGAIRHEMSTLASAVSRGEAKQDTTHITSIDEHGNACGITHSVGMGTGVVTPGLGFMHNCHMANFDPRPNQPNSIAPGKRGTGGGAPVFALRNGEVLLSMGSPAGNFKVSAMTQAIANVVDFGKGLADAVSADRIHVSSAPPRVVIDRRFDPRAALDLASRGYRVDLSDYSARIAAVSKDFITDGLNAASDVRGDRGAEVVQ